MEIEKIMKRHSVRGFLPTEVDPNLLDRTVRTALLAPSWKNSQPIKLYVISGKTKETISKKINEDAKKGISISPDIPMPDQNEWPEDIQIRMKKHTIERMKFAGIERHEKEKRLGFQEKMYRFFDAPHLLIFGLDEARTWSILDVGLAMQNVMISANVLGLSTCPMASAVYYPNRIRETLNLDENIQLIAGMAIGYPDLDDPVNQYHAEKLTADEAISWYG
ncbi:nitroreductase [Bacillus sp. 1P10SD]|uniref:nitroreductase n=1 Tax=Bacillus sp. 1P10SD TaxID=3132265 RepID=UPI0039A507FD